MIGGENQQMLIYVMNQSAFMGYANPLIPATV